jgi:hypothetical protein
VVKEFTAYYDLYKKYQNDYKVEEILTGTVNEQVREKARQAAFDERLSLMGMLVDKLLHEIRDNMQTSEMLGELMNPLRALKAKAESDCSADELLELLGKQAQGRQKAMESLQKAGALADRDKAKAKAIIKFLNACERQLRVDGTDDAQAAFGKLKDRFDEKVALYKKDTETVKSRLHFLFQFVEDAFGSGNEMLILVTECTVQPDCVKFISAYGCEDYQRHNEEMMLTERNHQLAEQIKKLEL